GRAPYTYLEVLADGRRFYGGPIPRAPAGSRNAPPRGTGVLRDAHEEIRQNYSKELQPGQELDTFIFTDYLDKLAPAVEGSQGELLWRVHVRRGLVPVGARDVSATAVIGVLFTEQDIHKRG